MEYYRLLTENGEELMYGTIEQMDINVRHVDQKRT